MARFWTDVAQISLFAERGQCPSTLLLLRNLPDIHKVGQGTISCGSGSPQPWRLASRDHVAESFIPGAVQASWVNERELRLSAR
jgi:hypothetical protein